MPDDFTFHGFDSPNYTQVPDQLFDELLAHLSGAEIKVLLYIVRRTFGFKKNHDAISLTQITTGLRTKDGRQLDAGTGLSKSTAIHALNGLERKNIIRRVREKTGKGDYATTTYALNLRNSKVQKSNPPAGGWSEKTTTPSSDFRTTVVRKSDLQQTVLQQTVLENVNVNAFKKIPEPTDEDPTERDAAFHARRIELLVGDILDVTGDRHSINLYRKLARAMPEGLIHMAISETKDAKLTGRIQKSPGAYFTDYVKQLATDRQIQLGLKPPNRSAPQ